jgi:PAS domain S-box-containing protein
VIIPPSAFLADVYRHLPFLVIHVTTDGVVLHCNPETSRVTGYEERELSGHNLWTLLFPGKLFAQVPRFISLVNPSPLLKDVPMTIRTRSGVERVIAWTRYFHTTGDSDTQPAGGLRTFICVGVDLTDRLLESERTQLPETGEAGRQQGGSFVAFGPHIGNAGAIDSEIVTPIAITPRPIGAGAAGPCPIEQVRDGMAQVETQINCVQGAFAEGEVQTVKSLATVVADTRAQMVTLDHGRMAFELLAREDEVQLRACSQTIGTIRARVEELLALYRPELK